jgi:hypothetical protein
MCNMHCMLITDFAIFCYGAEPTTPVTILPSREASRRAGDWPPGIMRDRLPRHWSMHGRRCGSCAGYAHWYLETELPSTSADGAGLSDGGEPIRHECPESAGEF